MVARAEQMAEQASRMVVRAAMVQGEYTLTFGLVLLLQRRGIACYAATTRRIVTETAQPGGAS